MKTAIALFLLALAQQQPASPRLWCGLTPGAGRAGFERLRDGELSVSVWYPARAGGSPMTFGDTLGEGAPAFISFLTGAGVPRRTADELVREKLFASAGAAALPGPYPLVLVGQGNREDTSDQAILCEYLASHGYVVASTPSPMIRTPMTSETEVGGFADRQALELERAIRAVEARFQIRPGIGVVSHSFGARAALLLAMREPRVAALVSLDGGIGTATGAESLRQAPSFDAKKALPPILHLYEDSDAFMKPDFTFLDSLAAKQILKERVVHMRHTHFTSFGFAAAVFPELSAVTHGTDGTRRAVVAVAERTLAFLESKIGKSQRSK